MLLMTMVLHLKDNFDITVIVVPLMEMVGQVFAENCFWMVLIEIVTNFDCPQMK